jgi:ribosomal protein L37E
MKSVHIICAKCGSTDMKFKIERKLGEYCGVDLICNDCGERTSVEEINERLEEENK